MHHIKTVRVTISLGGVSCGIWLKHSRKNRKLCSFDDVCVRTGSKMNLEILWYNRRRLMSRKLEN